MTDESRAGNSRRRESRARSEIAKVALRICGFFAVYVGAQWALIALGAFGPNPVIPCAFFVCTNGLLALVTVPLALTGILGQLKPFRFDYRGWLAALLTAAAVYGAITEAVTYLVRR